MRKVNIFSFANDALLLGQPGKVIGVLWTLKSEVAFSLVLPIFMFGAAIAKRIPFTIAVIFLYGRR